MKHARSDYNRIQDPDKKIPPSEPVFLIRGQDLFGPVVLLFYAELAEVGRADAKLVQSVRVHAEAMLDWQQRVRVKVPDIP